MKLTLTAIAIVLSFAATATPAAAHDFDAPSVSVVVSKLEPGGHPDIQTTIQLDSGESFGRVEITSPPASGGRR